MEGSLHGPRVFSLLFEVCSVIKGIPTEELVRKQYGVVTAWYSPYTAMAFRACNEDSHHKHQGPVCDKEYQLVAAPFNIEQSRILDVLHAQYGLQAGRRRFEERRDYYVTV